MRLAIVGPGTISIPPKGWGAVESLIWDYYTFIRAYHPDVEVHIINEKEEEKMLEAIRALSPDIVHLHQDSYIERMKKVKGPLVVVTAHYSWIERQGEVKEHDMYFKIFTQFITSGFPIFCLSSAIRNAYIEHGAEPDAVFIHHNGANEELYRYTETPSKGDRSAYVGKIEPRKRQARYSGISDIDFIGHIADSEFPSGLENWKREWTKRELQEGLTDYGNLVLLSEAEAHALVCCEALICGLGLVVSEYAAANLDRGLPFITVIPTERLCDLEFVEAEIARNRAVSLAMRPQIRAYGLEKFSWRPLVAAYVARLKELLERKTSGQEQP
jgi:glycosyltransferase involved in cell wall biosynthesis